MADLDNDGLPNDLVYVDPRVDRVIVAPVPGTGSRYEPFALDPAPLSFDPSTMAPTGCVIGDFNEDGLPDILVYWSGRSPILFLQQASAATPEVAVLTRAKFIPCELVEPYHSGGTPVRPRRRILDGDGHVDLIIGNYYPDEACILDANADGREQLPQSAAKAFNGGRNRLFLWEKPDSGSKASCPLP